MGVMSALFAITKPVLNYYTKSIAMAKHASGARLTTFLESFGLDQAEVCDITGLSRSFVSSIFAGRSKPSERFLVPLTAQFGLSASWVLFGQGPMLLDGRQEDPSTAVERLAITPEDVAQMVNDLEAHLDKVRKAAERLRPPVDLPPTLLSTLQELAQTDAGGQLLARVHAYAQGLLDQRRESTHVGTGGRTSGP